MLVYLPSVVALLLSVQPGNVLAALVFGLVWYVGFRPVRALWCSVSRVKPPHISLHAFLESRPRSVDGLQLGRLSTRHSNGACYPREN
jgi:hypothetical protein